MQTNNPSTIKAQQPQRRPAPPQAMLAIASLLGLGIVTAASQITPLPVNAPEQPGIDLRAACPPNKVNITSAEASELPEPPPETEKQTAEPPLLLITREQLPEVVPPPPVISEVAPPPFEMMTLVPVVFYDPGSLICSCFRDVHQGDTPMLRNWNLVKMSSLLAAALAVNTLPAAEPPQNIQEDMKALKDSVEAISKKLDTMSANIDKALTGMQADTRETSLQVKTFEGAIKALETTVATLKMDVEKMQGRVSTYPGEKSGMDGVMSRLSKIEDALARLAESRISNAPPMNIGRIQLVNMYPEEMLFLVNSKPYRLAPYTTANLDNQPAGPFNYEVISSTYGSRGTNRPMLEPGKTYTITVR